MNFSKNERCGMKPADLLTQNRNLADHFNSKEYPALFERVMNELPAYLNSDIDTTVTEILDEVESNMDKSKYSFRKERAMTNDRIVLSLFIIPAAAKLGTPEATHFAERFTAAWEERFGTEFAIGDYDKIMEGFDWKQRLFLK